MFRGWDSDRKLFVLLLVAAGGCLAFNYPDVLQAKAGQLARMANGALAQIRANLPHESAETATIAGESELAERTNNRARARQVVTRPTVTRAAFVSRSTPPRWAGNRWQSSNCTQINNRVWQRLIDCQGRVVLVRRCPVNY
jgi:hypothetical protein